MAPVTLLAILVAIQRYLPSAVVKNCVASWNAYVESVFSCVCTYAADHFLSLHVFGLQSGLEISEWSRRRHSCSREVTPATSVLRVVKRALSQFMFPAKTSVLVATVFLRAEGVVARTHLR